MLIDWFTVIAQIVNFLVLVALMKRYLWKPLLRGIDDRENRIATSLADAERRSADAAERVRVLEAEKADLEQRCSMVLTEAKQSAEARRLQLLEQARAGIRALEKKWVDEIERQRTLFFDELRRHATAEILAITRTALHDLAGADLQTGALRVFLNRLQTLDPVLMKPMAAGDISVFTPSELSQQARREIASAVEARLGAAVPIRFETSESLAWGVDMRGSGLRVGWTSDTYLDALEQKVREVLDALIASTPPVIPLSELESEAEPVGTSR